jgi:hypothetical protein
MFFDGLWLELVEESLIDDPRRQAGRRAGKQTSRWRGSQKRDGVAGRQMRWQHVVGSEINDDTRSASISRLHRLVHARIGRLSCDEGRLAGVGI